MVRNFFTGSDAVPLVVILYKPLEFNFSADNVMPTASTCALSLFLPTSIPIMKNSGFWYWFNDYYYIYIVMCIDTLTIEIQIYNDCNVYDYHFFFQHLMQNYWLNNKRLLNAPVLTMGRRGMEFWQQQMAVSSWNTLLPILQHQVFWDRLISQTWTTTCQLNFFRPALCSLFSKKQLPCECQPMRQTTPA